MSLPKCIALDFDGVLHEDQHYRNPFGEIDLTLLDQAIERGVPVCISTCNDTWRIATYLGVRGYPVRDDNREPVGGTLAGPLFWHDPRSVLVSNRKPSAYAYVDDRAVSYSYGQPTAAVWQAFEELRTV